MGNIDTDKMKALAAKLRRYAGSAFVVEAADAIDALLAALESSKQETDALLSTIAECRDKAHVEGYGESFLYEAIACPDDVPAFIGQTVTELRAALEAAAADKRDAERYRWMAERFLGADFEWGRGEDGYGGIPALIIELPEKAKVWGCLDLTIDDHLSRTPASEGEQK